MRRTYLLVVATGIATVSLGAPAPPAAPKPSSDAKPSGRMEMQARTGTLRTYRAGKSVVIAGPDGRLKRLPLDPAARVDRDLVRGQQVNVISLTDETGKERVSAISRGAGPVAAGGTSGPAAEAQPRR